MEYAQLNVALNEAIQITTHGDIEWDTNNFCSAAALVKDGLAEQFRVVPLTVTEAPTIDPLTQTVFRDGLEQVDGKWRYKWRVKVLTAEQIEAKRLTSVPTSVSPRQIRQALTRAGLRASVEAAVAAGDQDTKDWYEFATEFRRDSTVVTALGLVLGVSGLQLDDLWTLAGTL